MFQTELSSLETQWENEVDDIKHNLSTVEDVFFKDFPHHETKVKDLLLICFMKGISLEDNLTKAVNALKIIIEKEARQTKTNQGEVVSLAFTKRIVEGIAERIELLLQVSINTSSVSPTVNKNDQMNRMTKSLQSWPMGGDGLSMKRQMSCERERSLDDSILQIPKLQNRIRNKSSSSTQEARSIINDLAKGLNSDDKSSESVILDQLFSFIGSHPENAISSGSFLTAVETRKERGTSRKLALALMKKMLCAAGNLGGSTHLLSAIVTLIQKGPCVEELTCGGMVSAVQNAFSDTMTLIVQIASKYPMACKASIGQLCIIPYSRNEEKCLVKSGLVNLLDKLCSQNTGNLEDCESSPNEKQKLSLMAWAGFKVLANRCVLWEEDGLISEEHSEADSTENNSGLAKQVSALLTNHLVRATSSGDEAASNEALHEVLSLLNHLSKSKMGKAILSQPTCVSKLLSLLLEPRLSPKMIMIIVQLCHVALPLMSQESCQQVVLPNWSLGQEEVHLTYNDNSSKMIQLIMTKLADYLVPGCQASKLQTSCTSPSSGRKSSSLTDVNEDDSLNAELASRDMGQVMSLYIHKREDQSAHEVIQLLLNTNTEIRLFSNTGGQNMEKVVRMDKEMTKSHKAEVLTEDATLVLRKAIKLAQQGFVVSVAPAKNSDDHSEEAKHAVEQICKNRNFYLAKTDPVRPFISSAVANSLAAELIALIQSLLTCSAAEMWRVAIYAVLKKALKDFQFVIKASEDIFTLQRNELFYIYAVGREVLASLALMGGFTEYLKVHMDVMITGNDSEDDTGVTTSINEDSGMATISLNTGGANDSQHPVHVTIDRLKPVRDLNNESLQLFSPLAEDLVMAMQFLLIPDSKGNDYLSTALPASGDGRTMKLGTGRLIAETRTMACKVLSLYLSLPQFACRFLQKSCQAVDMLKCLAKECLPADRNKFIQNNCEKLRNLYRDCVKPSAPVISKSTKHQAIGWDPSKSFPPLKALLFTHCMHGFTYYTEPVMTSGMPRGVMVYGNQTVQAMQSFPYFEIDILSLGESPDDSGAPLLSIGLAPNAEKKEGTWSHPVGTMLFHNNGRVVHYNGASLLQWRSLRFDRQLNPGDTLGLGWEKITDSSPIKGTVFFTHNGTKLDQALEDISGNLYPVIHLQKKGIRIKANFGHQKFVFKDVPKINQFDVVEREAETSTDLSDVFGALPFYLTGDENSSESDAIDHKASYETGAGHRRINSVPGRIVLKPKSKMMYENDTSQLYRLQMSGIPLVNKGPVITAVTGNNNPLLDDDSDSEDEDDSDEERSHYEDINSLLVKAWETKVFPIIRRRFRNETERKDGLEQIKGALSLGMSDIARQTVEFLYEETGGIPRDLHLPTIEDVKEDMNKLTIDRIKKGQAVIISELEVSPPSYMTPMQMKTFGLVGEVLEVDSGNELIQVESYIKSEGVLVRFWYPLTMLEKSSVDASQQDTITGTQNVNIKNANIHKELLNFEFASSRLYLRQSYIKLLSHVQNPELSGFVPVDMNSPEMAMITSSIMLLQDLDIENVMLIAGENIANAPCTGNHLDNNLSFSHPEKIFDRQSMSLTKLFFNDHKAVTTEVREMILKAKTHSDQGEEHVIELSDQICTCMQLAPEYFPIETITINDVSILRSVLHFTDCNFVFASCKFQPEMRNKHPNEMQIQIQLLEGNKIKQNGLNSGKNVIEYPIEAFGGKDSHIRAFMPSVFASDKIRVSQSGGGETHTDILFHGIPHEFPLAMCFTEEVIRMSLVQPMESKVSYHILEHLGSLLCRTAIPPTVKEYVFHNLAQALIAYKVACASEKKTETPLPHLTMLASLYEELKTLFELEQDNDERRYSKYCQALFEVTIALSEVLKTPLPFDRREKSPPTPSASDKELSPFPETSSPNLSQRRRARYLTRRTTRSGSQSPRTSESCSKIKDMSWFIKAFTSIQVLKDLIKNTNENEDLKLEMLKTAVANVHQSTDYKRLLVLTGLPKHLEPNDIASAINRVVNNYGGLFMNELYIPEPVMPLLQQQDEPPESSTSPGTEVVHPNNGGVAILQVRVSNNINLIKSALGKTKLLCEPGEMDIAESLGSVLGLSITRVSSSLKCDESASDEAFEKYLKSKVFSNGGEDLLKESFQDVMTDIFQSCYFENFQNSSFEDNNDVDYISLRRSQILRISDGNHLYMFLSSIKQTRVALYEGVKEILINYGLKREQSPITIMIKSQLSPEPDCDVVPEDQSITLTSEADQYHLSLEGFLKFINDFAKQDIRSIFTGLFACGYDLQFNKYIINNTQELMEMDKVWNMEKDCALVKLINSLCYNNSIAPLAFSPNDIFLTMEEIMSADYKCLQDIPIPNLRTRFALMQLLNESIGSHVIPLTDFRATSSYESSLGKLLSDGRQLIFQNIKSHLVDEMLNSTCYRNSSHAPPEITLDPIEDIGLMNDDLKNTWFHQSMDQLNSVPSTEFCVPIATGGDPLFPFNIKMTGEEVQGNSGSFRHFLSRIVQELHSSLMPILIPYSGSGTYHGCYVMRHGPVDFRTEKLLQHFGQLLGIAMRAGIPIALDLVPHFWKALLFDGTFTQEDIRDFDPLTDQYLNKIQNIENEADFNVFLEEMHFPKFTYPMLSGIEEDLIMNGKDTYLSWNNRHQYISLIQKKKLEEMMSPQQFLHIRAGFATVAPIDLILNIFTPYELELRLCGMSQVSVPYLKAHTIYQVGLSESDDTHIQFFWSVLESFTQPQLQRFIKFACNQDRIPMTNIEDTTNVPPYPMKIAPSDRREDEPDCQNIRVETCLFMIKLPRYSTYEVMREKLLFAINSAFDPLSG